MNGWRPATNVTAFCIGIVALAAVFCFCFSRYLQIEYPVPNPVSKSIQVTERARTGEAGGMEAECPLIFSLICLQTKSGSRAAVDVRFKKAPWLLFSDQGEIYGDLDEADDSDEPGEEGTEELQRVPADAAKGGFHVHTGWYFRADRADSAFGEFIKQGKPAVLKTAEITYDDGTKRQAAVGTIKLYPKAAAKEEGGRGK